MTSPVFQVLQGVDLGALTAVLWFRLWRDGDCIKSCYRGHANPNAHVPLPDNVRARLDRVMQSWENGPR